MPNNQAHDPRVSLAQNRVAQAVGLNVAAIASTGGVEDKRMRPVRINATGTTATGIVALY